MICFVMCHMGGGQVESLSKGPWWLSAALGLNEIILVSVACSSGVLYLLIYIILLYSLLRNLRAIYFPFLVLSDSSLYTFQFHELQMFGDFRSMAISVQFSHPITSPPPLQPNEKEQGFCVCMVSLAECETAYPKGSARTVRPMPVWVPWG